MSNLTPEQKLAEWPTEPQRLTAGRYGNVQWGYAEYVGDYDYIGRKYELDRAEAAIARLRRLYSAALLVTDRDDVASPGELREYIQALRDEVRRCGDIPNE